MGLVCGRVSAPGQRDSPTDLATAHCFRQSASYRTPRFEGRTDAHQTLLKRQGSANTSHGGQNRVRLVEKRRFMSTRKYQLNDCRHRINASAIFTSI